ncbi:RNA deprotection pyrophosphohydrolase [Staphylococcus warneri]|uniref:Nucleoside triphosphatase YtkD n=1 Tax=Staphylococcus warneri TaxID=1292 RepID=A0A364UN69_STAWA|nr:MULTISPECIES: nucleoside triphosphatase YtkD [Staphylococcus]MBJ7885930.1 nucleoside triphosphatase YtkD [Bacillaceae bacterium HSR45]MCC8990038.1 nucleoside triphosphatase YtkD [Staphylococcus sp.]PAK73585.1 nucleoside triphosphatase YtkD [Staphylococcus pasteuri]AGC90289.1 MutT/NUDIX hydrolase family protein [Staphylococcus warneri SG1]AXZ23112.1 nucleoside triphosphatase YtkD [Staphylococcus warneri]
MYLKFLDKDQREVQLTYKANTDNPTGNHVLAIPVYQGKLLFTRHKNRGIEFPGGKREHGESSIDAIQRELYEETGAYIEEIQYIAQYTVKTNDASRFVKDVYFIQVSSLANRTDYLETDGPCLFTSIEDIPYSERSFLLQDDAILHCFERVISLGLY